MSELREQRDRDFMYECRRQMGRMLAEDGKVDADLAIRRAMKTGAPAYYVSFTYAQRVVSSLLRNEGASGECNGGGRADRRRMMLEIAGKTRRLMESCPEMTMVNALSHVLIEERASSWFISPSYARRLFYMIRKGSHRRLGRRCRKLLG